MKIIDTHIHIGHKFEWTNRAQKVWMETGPYIPYIYDADGNQLPGEYGDAIIKEGVFGGVLIPEYSPSTAGVMPVERAVEINRYHPELIPIANINPNFHHDPLESFENQLAIGARALKLHPIHGFFYANDKVLYPLYERCQAEDLPVLFHAGTSLFEGAKMRYSDPYTFDDVINDFPGLKVVLCHGGRGFWYQIAEFLVKSFEKVYIDISGLPPANFLKYWPSMKKFSHKFIFGTDFPGVPGIRKNYEQLRDVLKDDRALEKIGFQNAYDLYGFWKEGLFSVNDASEIFAIVDDASKRYKGVIPDDCYHEPYMPMSEVREEMGRMQFYGYRRDLKLLGVMGKERIKDVTLIRHAYVLPEEQGKGIGSKILNFIEKQIDTEWLLIGTWKAADWAIRFYQEFGFELMENKNELLRTYWDITDRQIETSCVLGKKINQ
ncbi:MAG: GNAT family N-acetyltransferase [Syntrophorhabdus sp.]